MHEYSVNGKKNAILACKVTKNERVAEDSRSDEHSVGKTRLDSSPRLVTWLRGDHRARKTERIVRGVITTRVEWRKGIREESN